MIAQQRATPAMSGSSFFSQISSFFGGASDTKALGGGRRNTAFGNGLPSSSRRGPPRSLDADAWSLPYSSQANIPTSPAYMNAASGAASPITSHYPPTSSMPRAPSPYAHDHSNGAVSTSSVAEFSNMYPAGASASASTSTFVGARPGAESDASSLSATAVVAGSSMPSNAYPPMRHTWNRIRRWCNKNYPEISDTLNWPCTEEALDELEMTIGFTLPAAVRESYLNYDGQELESNQSCQDGLFFGAALLSLDQIAEEWSFWRAVDEDPETGSNPHVRNLMASCPHKWIRAEYSCRGWIPLITDHAGNYIGVDLSPHPAGGGAAGQVIIFGRDFDTKVVCWKGEGEGGWGRFLQSFADELEAGEFCTLEEPTSGSDDDEDMIGYESYFSGGGAGASKGGGDRAGEGAAGFRLTGEYKGWPVLEAWADLSTRQWAAVGLAPGKPIGNPQQAPAGPLSPRQAQRFSMMATDDVTMLPSLQRIDENGEPLDVEGSGIGLSAYGASNAGIGTSGATSSSSSSPSGAPVGREETNEVAVDGPSHPLADASLAGDESAAELITPADAPPQVVEPIAAAAAIGKVVETDSGSVTPTNSTRQVSGMLSPPMPETKASLRSKQKQREEGWGSSHVASQAQRRRPARPAPAPAMALDLPTIDDVKAIQAAVMADDGRSHSVQFDPEAQLGSAGAWGKGSLGFRDLAGKLGGSTVTGKAGGSVNGVSSRREESVELEHRQSGDALGAPSAIMNHSNSSSSYIVGMRGRARGLG
ncbi:hypothetical protein BCV70DRAFT_148595, partial [Testicularia cyperi]